MNDIKINEELNQLFYFYKVLLTDTQQLYFRYYYEENYTLQEIAEIVGVSRNAIYDQLEKTKERLYDLESKLHLKAKHSKLLKIINKVKQTKDANYLDELIKEGEENE